MNMRSFLLLDRPKTLTGVVVILIAAFCFVYAKYIAEPTPKSEKTEDLAKFVASPDFQRLPLEKQKYYTSKLRGNQGERPNFRQMRQTFEKLSETERRTAFENMRRADEVRRNKEALAYVKMSREERIAYLDRQIAEFDRRAEEMRKRMEQRQQNRPQGQQNQNRQNGPQGQQNQTGRTGSGQRPNFAERMRGNMEKTPPEVRAARTVMMREMMERRKETGKAMPARPQRGGRGG